MKTTGAPPLHRRLISIDTTLSCHFFTFSQHCFPASLLHLIEYAADFSSVVLVSLLLFLVPYSAPIRRPFLLPVLVGILLDRVLGRRLRRLLPRSRPLYGGNMSNGVSIDRNSFPSGHSSRACLVAALFELSGAEMGGSAAVVRVGWVVWGWAAATSFSRVLLGRHHVSDVVAGACLGVLEAFSVFHFLKLF